MRAQPFRILPRPLFRSQQAISRTVQQKRALIPPPTKGTTLTERRSDRALPPLRPPRPWLRTAPIFIAILVASALGIFNYQKSSSSVVSSTLYSLRTNPRAREILGDEIYFKHRFPWIWGELNQLHGRIDIAFRVKGSRDEGLMRFRSRRRGRGGKFVTQEWSLETKDGEKIQLLSPDEVDPFLNTTSPASTQ